MEKASAKVSIFEMNKGAHEMRFVPFKDISDLNSKYRKEPALVDSEQQCGRDHPIDFPFVNPP